MKNITDLRNELTKVFESLKNGEIDVRIASELNNCAGKIINTCRVEIEYSSVRQTWMISIGKVR
jgi:hypothetical protein